VVLADTVYSYQEDFSIQAIKELRKGVFMTKKHIVAVDDTPANLLLVLRVMEKHYKVTCVQSGKECLDLLAEQSVDLVLMDVVMPKMNGYECCRHIRDEHPQLPPVIFLSGQTRLEDKLRGYAAGGTDYLTKPCDIDELLSKVKLNLEVKDKSKGPQFDYNSYATLPMSQEQGLDPVQQFSHACLNCNSRDELANLILKTLQVFNFNACLQIRSNHQTLNYSLTDNCAPLENSLMTGIAGYAKATVFGRLILCASNCISLLIKNMPTEDDLLYGRLKDLVNTLLANASNRMDRIKLNVDCKQKFNEQPTKESFVRAWKSDW